MLRRLKSDYDEIRHNC